MGELKYVLLFRSGPGPSAAVVPRPRPTSTAKAPLRPHQIPKSTRQTQRVSYVQPSISFTSKAKGIIMWNFSKSSSLLCISGSKPYRNANQCGSRGSCEIRGRSQSTDRETHGRRGTHGRGEETTTTSHSITRYVTWCEKGKSIGRGVWFWSQATFSLTS